MGSKTPTPHFPLLNAQRVESSTLNPPKLPRPTPPYPAAADLILCKKLARQPKGLSERRGKQKKKKR